MPTTGSWSAVPAAKQEPRTTEVQTESIQSRPDHEPVALRSRWSPLSLAMSVHRADGENVEPDREHISDGCLTGQQHGHLLRTVRPMVWSRRRRSGQRILPTTGRAVTGRHERARVGRMMRIEVRSRCVAAHRARVTVDRDVVTATRLGRGVSGRDKQKRGERHRHRSERTPGERAGQPMRTMNGGGSRHWHRGVSVYRNGTHTAELC